jgi:ppGpp synthetase/RelA/SpoT-type nucleotidyltranferase
MIINKENIEREYRDYYDDFKSIAEEIKKSLERIRADYYNLTKFVVFIPPLRIKTFNSIVKKLEIKGRSAESLVVESGDSISIVSNDFIGGRILCNTKEDVIEIEKLINKHHRFKVEKRELIDKSSGYKALHLDLYYEAFWRDKRILIPLELQIKTHLQHAWAEITHDDAYKPGDDAGMDQALKDYYKHISGVMDGVDGLLSTIRVQKLAFVSPPSQLSDADTIINAKTLSYKINIWKKGVQLTIQEMNLVLRRLKDEGFETLKDVTDLLDNPKIEVRIKNYKEGLGKKENVNAFELLTYGALLLEGKDQLFEEEIKQSLGFVNEECVDCGRILTKDEYDYIVNETDSDFKFYCIDHRGTQFFKSCRNCGKRTSKDLCLKCEAETDSSF